MAGDPEVHEPTDDAEQAVEDVDPDAPGRWLFEDPQEADAPEPNEPG